jgi:3-hydroxyisobutyrate dehydrogenase
MSAKPVVAVLGLGTMGSGMAHRLLGAGYSVRLFNRSSARYKAFEGSPAVLCQSPAHAATGADIVISMVSDDAVSRSLWLGPQGALSTAGQGAVLVECSTLSLDWIRGLSELAGSRGCRFLDAPVTGSKDQAEAGTLKFLAGGDAATITEIAPVLAAMSVEVIRLGPVGSGTMLKLVNNFICGAQIAALAEGLAVLSRCELDQEAALAVLVKGAISSPLVQTIMARVAANNFAPNFSVSLIEKDLSYAVREAAKVGVDLTTGESARARFQQAQADGMGEQDIASLVKWLQQSPHSNNKRAS